MGRAMSNRHAPVVADIALFAAPFIYLRHGETTSNRDEIIAGSLDVELTDQGRAQAAEAGRRLATLGLSTGPVVTSSRRRARDTAMIVAGALGHIVTDLIVLPDLDERNWGALEGRPRRERRPDALPADLETLEAFHARTARALAAIAPAGGQRLPLVVAHSGTWRVLCRLTGVTAAATPVGNALPIRVAPEGDCWRADPL